MTCPNCHGNGFNHVPFLVQVRYGLISDSRKEECLVCRGSGVIPWVRNEKEKEG